MPVRNSDKHKWTERRETSIKIIAETRRERKPRQRIRKAVFVRMQQRAGVPIQVIKAKKDPDQKKKYQNPLKQPFPRQLIHKLLSIKYASRPSP